MIPHGDTERWHFLHGVRLGEDLLAREENDSATMCALTVGEREHHNVVQECIEIARSRGPQVEAGLCAVLSDLVTSGEKCRPGTYVRYALEAFGVLDGERRPEPRAASTKVSDGGAA
ncbi:MAG: hypothetical protein AB7G76_06265 [Steroidobacteraceae bacterium]